MLLSDILWNRRGTSARSGWTCRILPGVLGSLAAGLTVAGEPAKVIGYIDSFSGSSSQYEILRDVETSPPVKVRTELHEGDWIRVKENGNTMTIRFTDGSREQFGPVATDYGPFSERGEQASILSNLWNSLASTVTDVRDRQVQAVAVTSRGTGGPIVLGALFAEDPLNLAAGRRKIFLRWDGGEAPYRVVISQVSDGRTVVDVDGIEEPTFRGEPIDLSVGEYVVEISDARRITGFRFQVVNADTVPDEIAAPGSSAAASAYLNAYALAVADNDVWQFESYQRLFALADEGYDPARLLLDDLEAGGSSHWAKASN